MEPRYVLFRAPAPTTTRTPRANASAFLFIPEMVRAEREAAITRRRAAIVNRAVASEAREVSRLRDFAGPAGRYPFTGFQMMTFFVASSPGAGATSP